MTLSPVFGWTLLSRDALKKAEAYLKDSTEGVRDEIGFLALHQAYADRFFPGTSVLHTRLRYVLFVPWLYERAAKRLVAERTRVDRLMQAEELVLAGQLKQAGERGVIGGDNYPKPTSQPPSMVYWSALNTWGILKPNADGSSLARSDLHRALQALHRRSRLLDDDKAPLDEGFHFFVKVPDPPSEFDKANQPLDFHLSTVEGVFLKQRLSSVMRPREEGVPSLLARLSQTSLAFGAIHEPWHKKIVAEADAADKAALNRAKQAAAISAIGRGIYAALVEQACEKQDKRKVGSLHRDHLKDVVAEFHEDALGLNLTDLGLDAARLSDDPIQSVLEQIQTWLKSGSKDLQGLRSSFEPAERRRKGRRARLSDTLAGQQRRAEWEPDKHTQAEPLHYRWPKVQRLLQDLHDAP